ncbi:hypothetical protein Q31a_00770 [Aureliella helgolandensis]|uniref:Lipopolysaccharide-assembly n=1 Tax=Aureliella helgolandensis TaxID=2527968 RepID=A0A518FZL3_9BACT|nr:hypothetical protein Q31a_00770 [Aureliella helgolandensis]
MTGDRGGRCPRVLNKWQVPNLELDSPAAAPAVPSCTASPTMELVDDSGTSRNLPCLARRRWLGLAPLALLCLGTAAVGCAGYQLGSRSLFNPNIRTVHIPVIRNDTWRHNIGVQLTEAVIKVVELNTPYKVVGPANPDSTLTCRVATQTKRTVTEASTDEPRVIETLISLEVTWLDRQGNPLMENRFVPMGEFSYYFIQGADFVPEGGQSMATAQQKAVERLADQIVQQMEIRW